MTSITFNQQQLGPVTSQHTRPLRSTASPPKTDSTSFPGSSLYLGEVETD